VTTFYVMEALENYDPATASALLAGTYNTAPNYQAALADNQIVGAGFNAVTRTLNYIEMLMPTPNDDGGDYTNPTGFSLWDGEGINGIYGPSDSISIYSNLWPTLCQKNIDTGVITAFNTYSSAKTVPANVGSINAPSVSAVGSGYTHATATVTGGGGSGMQAIAVVNDSGFVIGVYITNWGSGYTSQPTITITGDGLGATVGIVYNGTGSDGTWRRIGIDFSMFGGNNPVLVNPRNNDVFVEAESCEVYQLRASQNYAQEISPLHVYDYSIVGPNKTQLTTPFALDDTWVYCCTAPILHPSTFVNLVLMPVSITSEEVTADQKLPYVEQGLDVWPFDATFGTDGNLYFFTVQQNAGGMATNGLLFSLIKYEPPTFAAIGTVSPGIFTDITPWTSTTGPNAAGLTYTNDWFGYAPANNALVALWRQPTSNRATGIYKCLKEFVGSGGTPGTDFLDTQFGCVNLQLGNSPAYDNHPAFVTGYMTSSWATTNDPSAAAYAVVDFRELDVYLDQSDYAYSADYTKRWIFWDCYPVSGGVVDMSNGMLSVMTQYQFAYGSPPSLLQFFDESGWDSAYTTYATAIGNPYVVQNSLYDDLNIENTQYGYMCFWREAGLYDATHNAFWWSGRTVGNQYLTAFQNMFDLNPAFTYRSPLNQAGAANAPITPPFLRLTLSTTPPPPMNGRRWLAEIGPVRHLLPPP